MLLLGGGRNGAGWGKRRVEGFRCVVTALKGDKGNSVNKCSSLMHMFYFFDTTVTNYCIKDVFYEAECVNVPLHH